MRNVWIVFATLAASASLVHAEPAHVDQDFAFGGMTGFNGEVIPAVATFSYGHEIPRTPLWLRGQAGFGTASRLFDDGSGTFSQLRVGIEIHACAELACLVLGTDVGRQTVHWSGIDEPEFDGGQQETIDETHTVIVPRIGLDVGGAVRVRPSLELPVTEGQKDVDVSLALACRW